MILTFPLISSSVVPVLSGLSIFVGAVQCQLARPSESAGGRGRPAGDGRNERRWRPHRQRSHQACSGLCQDAVGHVVRVERAQTGVEAGVVLGSSGGSWRERVGEKAGVELLQVSGSSSMRGAREVRAVREVRVHPKVASPLKVFPQDLGALLLVHQPASRGSQLMRAVEVMSHEAEFRANSRGGGSRGRSRRVVRGGGCCCL